MLTSGGMEGGGDDALGSRRRGPRQWNLRAVDPEPILLEDRSHATADATWVRAVSIPTWEIVDGGDEGEGAGYASYLVSIRTSRGQYLRFHRRYTDFTVLHHCLKQFYDNVPDIPGRTFVARFDPNFLDRRRQQLEWFLMEVLLDPILTKSRPVRVFCHEG